MDFSKLEDRTEIPLSELYSEGLSFDDFQDNVMDWIQSQEVIYYYKAMDMLREHDPSLTKSLNLAQDFGYEPKNLNSEVLATLLYQDLLTDVWYWFENGRLKSSK